MSWAGCFPLKGLIEMAGMCQERVEDALSSSWAVAMVVIYLVSSNLPHINCIYLKSSNLPHIKFYLGPPSCISSYTRYMALHGAAVEAGADSAAAGQTDKTYKKPTGERIPQNQPNPPFFCNLIFTWVFSKVAVFARSRVRVSLEWRAGLKSRGDLEDENFYFSYIRINVLRKCGHTYCTVRWLPFSCGDWKTGAGSESNLLPGAKFSLL
ncbi:hypothetical protein K438DRAFT_1762346 [Mycena galopus ATCC 62051]|nr:hypothetical protein K438DRAFT_1762346 [Mycena galopus ATCC 62051]